MLSNANAESQIEAVIVAIGIKIVKEQWQRNSGNGCSVLRLKLPQKNPTKYIHSCIAATTSSARGGRERERENIWITVIIKQTQKN